VGQNIRIEVFTTKHYIYAVIERSQNKSNVMKYFRIYLYSHIT